MSQPDTSFRRTLTISYSWRLGGKSKKVPKQHEEFLEEDALERIFKMVKAGYVEGELNTYVSGTEYSGYWEVKHLQPDTP